MAEINTHLPNAEYHAHPAIGSSGIKLLRQSPLHYWSAYLDPDRERREATPAQRIGTAWHASIFEPDDFARTWIAKPDINQATKRAKLLAEVLENYELKALLVAVPEGITAKTKEGKALFAEIEAAGKIPVDLADWNFVNDWEPLLRGKETLSAEDMERIQKMTAAANAHPASRLIFREHQGLAETSIFWTDRETGVRCKIRPDYHITPCKDFPHGLIVDGKTTEDASAEGFAKSAWGWDMHIQAAFYGDGFQQAYKTKEAPLFLWLAQEKAPPYATAYHSAPADLVAYGRKLYRPMLKLLAHCQLTNTWPGYPQQINALELPTWAAKQVSDALAA